MRGFFDGNRDRLERILVIVVERWVVVSSER